MLCLGIESTSHTFGIGIVKDRKILADERSIYKPPPGKGIIPREAAIFHSENAKRTLERALQQANIKLSAIDIIGFASGPGLPPCLRIGAVVARCLSLKYKKPLIAVNHQVGHVEIGKLTTGAEDPITLYVSGGSTAILAFVGNKYRTFGSTQDIPIGNALDMLAHELNLPMSGGPQIEVLAKKGAWINLPYTIKGCDLSFTGILTEAIKKFKQGIKPEDVAYSFQETCFAMLTEVVERAVAHTDKEEVLLTGGVAANKRLQEMLSIMCKERGAKFFVVPKEYSGDNGAMIGVTGLLAYNSGQRNKIEETKINQKWRTDEVEISWI